jgi:DNA mismatch endonuclease (patch repair protein)
MTDNLTPERRSENMRRIKSSGMEPELFVRRMVHRMGYRYRLHGKDLPGKPDLVFRPRRKVIFVHGCFWHSHEHRACADGQRRPKSNLEYWGPKLARNRERDEANVAGLAATGWAVLVIWECQTANSELLKERIRGFIDGE